MCLLALATLGSIAIASHGVSSNLTWVIVGVLALGALLTFRPVILQSRRVVEQYFQASPIDGLTRVLNRPAFLRQAEAELTRARQAGAPTVLIMANLDHFSQVNERHGSEAGDLALRHFATIAQTNLRSDDRIGRLGGEEFGILLSGTALEGATIAAERIRERLAGSTAALMPDNCRVFVTSSFGVTVAASTEGIAALLARAEENLHRAKREGRNQVVASAPSDIYTPLPKGGPVLVQRSAA